MKTGTQIRLYLDDVRPCPEGWTLAKTAKSAISILEKHDVKDVSLDHDLGDDKNGTGNDVLVWIEAKTFLDENYIPPKMQVHSDNPAAVQKMKMGIDRVNEEYSHRIRSKGKQICNTIPE